MKQFFKVQNYNEEYGFFNCTDSCGNLFRIDLFSDGEINGSPESVIGKKISVEQLFPIYIGLGSKIETRLR